MSSAVNQPIAGVWGGFLPSGGAGAPPLLQEKKFPLHRPHQFHPAPNDLSLVNVFTSPANSFPNQNICAIISSPITHPTPPSAFRHPPSAFRHPPPAFRHPPSASRLPLSVCGLWHMAYALKLTVNLHPHLNIPSLPPQTRGLNPLARF
jgi:hypothetical protein